MTDQIAQRREQDLAGKLAVVTGSSTGIGRQIALSLSRSGAEIIAHGRRPSAALKEVIETVSREGGSIQEITCDLSEDSATLMEFVDACWAVRGAVDIWINNAGADILTGSLASFSFEDKLDALYRVDVRGTALLARRVGELMLRAGGGPGSKSILNMGWDQALQGMEGDSGLLFGVTKGSVMALTKSLAQTLAPIVRVNCLAPGWIKTDWGAHAHEAWQMRAQNESLMQRWGTPDDVAAMAVYLCSPKASFISGQVICINGGFQYQTMKGHQ